MCDDWDENKNNEEIGYANYYNINDEKKILERKLVEESDISLSKELFGTELIGTADILGTVDILGTDKLKDKNYTNITLQKNNTMKKVQKVQKNQKL